MNKNSSKPKMLSREEVRESFIANGQTVVDWALERGFKPAEVYSVLGGKNRGRRGRGHDIAVALGLKAKPANPST